MVFSFGAAVLEPLLMSSAATDFLAHWMRAACCRLDWLKIILNILIENESLMQNP